MIESSGIRKVFDLAQHLKHPIDLSIGQASFDVPEEIKQIAIESIRAGFNRYTVTQGIHELRHRIHEKIKREKGFDGHVMVTSGVFGGLFLALAALVDPEDEVLIGDPYFMAYKHLTNFFGGKVVAVDTYPDFKCTAARLESYITPKTKLIILCSPSNPTGAVLNDPELREIADLARRHNLLVISDESYESFTYDEPHKSICTHYENTLLLSGLSKSCGMAGWRIGYAMGPTEIVHEMIKLQQYTFVCAPSFTQKAAIRALDLDNSWFIEDYRRKRDFVLENLRDLYEVRKPGGAFYIFPRVPWGTDEEFVAKALENNLLVIPGSVFSEKHTHFRISYSASDETLERGVGVLRAIAVRK